MIIQKWVTSRPCYLLLLRSHSSTPSCHSLPYPLTTRPTTLFSYSLTRSLTAGDYKSLSSVNPIPLSRPLSSGGPNPLPHHDITYQEQPDHPLEEKDEINVNKLLRNIQRDVRISPDQSGDKSSRDHDLTSSYWVMRGLKWSELPTVYLQLSKSRLTTLVVLTAVAGFAFNPVSGTLSSLAALSAGTFLCSASANTCNQVMEAPFDAQMDRCKQRVMVRHLVTPLHAMCFSAGCGVLGTTLLFSCTNPLTAALGAANIVLYAGVYTTMKRYTIANTWLGSLVGAIPPAMGWAAASGTLDWGAAAMCGLIYFWQFPHFNSLSYNVRQDYCRAGYHMMSVTDIKLNSRVALRNTLALIPLCILIPFTGISHCSFSFYSVVVNTYFSYLAWNFYQDPNKQTARELFRFSLVYLPIIFGFLAIGYAFKERTGNDHDKHHGDGQYMKDLCPVTVLPQSAASTTMCPVANKQLESSTPS